MAADSPDPPDKQRAQEFEHGPRLAQRIPRSEYTQQFLIGLQARGEVRAVSDGWDEKSANFPPAITWVIYPNGDLQRIGFN
jgi:hypothetical protein